MFGTYGAKRHTSLLAIYTDMNGKGEVVNRLFSAGVVKKPAYTHYVWGKRDIGDVKTAVLLSEINDKAKNNVVLTLSLTIGNIR